MTDGAIDFIEKNMSATDKVIEFGGGWSSLWWAKRAAWTLTVEADYKWAAKLLHEMSAHPKLMARWSLRFVACEWSNQYTKPKRYWEKYAAGILSEEVAINMEDHYMRFDFEPDVIVIDGSARGRNVIVADEYIQRTTRARMIIVDNMEWLHRYTAGRFAGFTQYDFHEYDLNKIPVHQNGKWNTAVWIRD
jgi:hypothetical protein